MGNTHAFYYRLPALFAASFASCAVGLLAISGSLCQFVEVKAKEGHLLYIPDATEPPTETNTYLGVICINPLYEKVLDNDLMFMLSRVCLFVAIAIGSFTCVLSWALSSFISPTEANWKLLSVFAAVSAVLQMPVFLIFETDPCTAFGMEQECVISTGSFYLILSTAFWVVVTLATQFLDPPRWADELNAWRTKSSAGSRSSNNGGAAEGESQVLLLPPKKSSLMSGFQRWANQRRWAASAELPKNQTDSLSVGGEEEDLQQTQIVKYINRTNSGLVLNVLPNGKRPDDDAKSVQSFEDLDSIVRMVEEGRMTDSNSLAPPSRNNSFSPDQPEQDHGDHKNLQMVVWDNIKEEEAAEKELVKQIYNDLEDTQPALDRQLVVTNAPTVSPWALALQPTDLTVLPAVSPWAVQLQPSNQNSKAAKVADTEDVTERNTCTKPPKVIKSLTDNFKKRSKVRRSRNKKYALMDDDDSESSHPVLPVEVIIHNSDSGSLPDGSGTPTRQAEFPCYDESALNSLRRRKSFGDEEYPDPIISMGSFESSTEEDEADPIISSTLSIEMDASSADATEDEDSDSEVSSESAGSEERQRPTPSRDRQRSRRNPARGFSSVRSVVSSTSLLDTIIAEETDADLLEHEDAQPYDLVRSKSAPTQLPVPTTGGQYCQPPIRLNNDHASVSTLGSSLFQHSNTVSDFEHDKIQLAPIPSLRRSRSLGTRRSAGSSHPSGMVTTSPDTTFDTDLEDPVDAISFSSSVHQVQVHQEPVDIPESTISLPDDEKKEDSRDVSCLAAASHSQSTSDSFEAAMAPQMPSKIYTELPPPPPPPKCSSPLSPALTAPETPSPDTSIQQPSQQDLSHHSYDSHSSWKEERQLRGGIHAPLDDSDHSSREASADLSIRVREARIQRLKREEAIKRGRAQSHDPTSRCRLSSTATMSSAVDKLDLQLIEVLRPDGQEYGPDEQSL